MSLVTTRTIKLKRTSKPISNASIKDVKPAFGEPIYLDNEDYLIVGDGTAKVKEAKVFKAHAQDIAEKTLYIKNNTNNQITTQDEAKNEVFIKNRAQDVVVDNYGSLTNLKEVLADEKTKIDAVYQENLKYAASDTKGGASNKVKTTPAVNSTKFYITGVAADATTDLYRASANASGSANTQGVYFTGDTGVLYGAAWNDFAEFRKCSGEPGECVRELGDGCLVMTTQRLQAGCSIISDTYGMVIGCQEEGYMPVALAGRVLVKTDWDRNSFEPGAAVCSGVGGTVSMMTREEIKEYPDRIVGYVSEIPTYKKWNNVEVNDRIWVKVK